MRVTLPPSGPRGQEHQTKDITEPKDLMKFTLLSSEFTWNFSLPPPFFFLFLTLGIDKGRFILQISHHYILEHINNAARPMGREECCFRINYTSCITHT